MISSNDIAAVYKEAFKTCTEAVSACRGVV